MPRETVRPRSVTLLSELVRSKDFTVRDMADRLPCGKTMINDLMLGKKATCSKALGDRIAEVLGVAPHVLFAPVEYAVVDTVSTAQDSRRRRHRIAS